jgi:hypothetical protein
VELVDDNDDTWPSTASEEATDERHHYYSQLSLLLLWKAALSGRGAIASLLPRSRQTHELFSKQRKTNIIAATKLAVAKLPTSSSREQQQQQQQQQQKLFDLSARNQNYSKPLLSLRKWVQMRIINRSVSTVQALIESHLSLVAMMT